MWFTDDDMRLYDILQTRCDDVRAKCQHFEGSVFALHALRADLCTLVLAQMKLFVRSIDDPIEEWDDTLTVLMNICDGLFKIWYIHGSALCDQLRYVWRKSDFKSTEEQASIDSIVIAIGKKKWAATLSTIPCLSFCLVVVIGYPIFKALQIGHELSRRFTFAAALFWREAKS